MKAHFRDYIGRRGVETKIEMQPEFKKFTRVQCDMLISAYINGINIRIISCWRKDVAELAQRNAFNIETIGDVFERTGKEFNKFRQQFFNVSSHIDSKQELWIAVFPSSEYVDQIAELVQAIVQDFPIPNNSSGWTRPTVFTSHFPLLESSIVEWSGFKEAVKGYVRHGDVVAIGHLSDILPTIEDLGFVKTFPSYVRGGENGMFGVNILHQAATKVRMVIVGFDESFWGSASGQYAKALAELGSKHILYASKAATASSSKHIYQTHCPTIFSILKRNSSRKGQKYTLEDVTPAIVEHKTLQGFGIGYSGKSTTVPTVIGEDETQRKYYDLDGIVNLDCENGHIAKGIKEVNESLYQNDSPRAGNRTTKFLPIHFITDYIHKSHERIQTSAAQGLAAAQAKQEVLRNKYETAKSNSFRLIGQAFSFYAMSHGLRDTVTTQPLKPPLGFEDYSSLLQSVWLPLARGDGRIAHEALYNNTEDHSADRILALAAVCQKSGFLTPAFGYLSRLQELKVAGRLDAKQSARLYSIDLKMHCQIGDCDTALSIIESVKDANFNDLKNIGQLGAVCRRILIVSKWCGRVDLENLARSALDANVDLDINLHATGLFSNMGKLWGMANERPTKHFIETYRSELSNIRSLLFEQTVDSKFVSQTNPEKGAHACLFLEAAMDLVARENKDGNLKLRLAHVLNNRNGGAEASEAYGEIVNSIPDLSIRDKVVWAMRRDSVGREAFNKIHLGREDGASKVNPIQLLGGTVIGRETEIQNYLRDLKT